VSDTATVDLKSYIRDVPDFPKPGIVFKDITPLLGNAKALEAAVDKIADHYKDRGIQLVAGVESRGFLFAAAVALKLGAGVIPVRKKGKLPYKTIALSYELEYGTDTVEVHEDAAPNGEKVLLIDDLIATGGTAAASAQLLEKAGGKVESVCFLVELAFLNGREKLNGYDVHTLLTY
jgi:adenine phosphoribosyltransferase